MSDEDPSGSGRSYWLTRRDSLATLGALSGLAGCSDDVEVTETKSRTTDTTEGPDGSVTDSSTARANAASWEQDVDAQGHALSNLGSLATAADDTPIRTFAGGNLRIADDGTLTADEVPDTIHYVNDYPGDTLDAKIDAAIDRIVSSAGSQGGHRIVIPPPSPEDPAAVNGAAWRFESPVEITDNIGKINFDLGRTLIFATDTIESFFVIGPDEKTEEVNFDGGYFYASGNDDSPNVTRSFFQILGIGHMRIEEVYCQNLSADEDGFGRDESRNVPMGFEITAEQGTSGVFLGGCSVTGCDEALRAEGISGLNVTNFTGGGGQSSIVLDGCDKCTLQNIDTGSASIQSISRELVRLENAIGPNREIQITGVRETRGNYDYHAGVNAVDTAGDGEKHRGLHVSDVAVHNATYSTDMEWAIQFDQRALSPAPAYSATQGATRAYDEGVQTFSTMFSHEFRAGGNATFSVGENDVTVAGAGNGAVLTTPDGESQYRVRLDNDGNLVTEEIEGRADRSGIVDSFEDGDLSEYFGATGEYEVDDSSPVSHGDYSVKNTTGDTAIVGSTSGLPRYPKAGDTLSARAARTETNPNLGVAFGMQDTDNFYFARIYPEDDEGDNSDRLQLYKRVDGEYTQLAKSVADVATDVLYKFVIDWGKTGDIAVSVRQSNGVEVATVQATDTTFTEGGVGARRTGVLDEIRIEESGS